MSERWESDSLRWVHSVRKQSYKKTKGKSLEQLAVGPSAEARALAKKLGLQRVPLRSEQRPASKNKAPSR
jgi:hypothetical protein